jgi:hypothetical protein
MNTQLSILLNKFIKDKILSIEVLSSLLNQSKDSVYRRLRGETDFLLNEAFIIANKLEISIDALHKENISQTIFRTKQFVFHDDAIDTIQQYINELHTDLEKVAKAGVINLYYAAKDLPLFCFFSSATLTNFKLYFWYITLFNNSSKKLAYQQDWLPKNVVNKAIDLYRLYNQTNSVEIWNFETINSTLHQIQYCLECGLINTSQAHELMDAMLDFVNNLDDFARAGNKNKIGKLTMYLNEILLLDNSVIFDLGFQHLFYLPYQTLNFLSTTDENFAKQNLEWFQKQIAKSTLISGDGEKDRNKLMNHYRKEIKKYRSKIGEE